MSPTLNPNPKPLALSDHHRQAHDLGADATHVTAHRLVVEGLYFARPAKRDAEGSSAKRQARYREEFLLDPHEHRLTPQGALAHVLADLLPSRLRSKDPEFRGLKTHHVVEHENLLKREKPQEEKTTAATP